jgi:hypothetical protein
VGRIELRGRHVDGRMSDLSTGTIQPSTWVLPPVLHAIVFGDGLGRM